MPGKALFDMRSKADGLIQGAIALIKWGIFDGISRFKDNIIADAGL